MRIINGWMWRGVQGIQTLDGRLLPGLAAGVGQQSCVSNRSPLATSHGKINLTYSSFSMTATRRTAALREHRGGVTVARRSLRRVLMLCRTGI